MKTRKPNRAPKVLACVLLIILCLCAFAYRVQPVLYAQYRYPNEAYFGRETYAEILYRASPQEREAVAPVLAMAEAVFAATEEPGNDVGALSRYAHPLGKYQAVSEEHEISLITTRHDGQSGYLWVAYWQKGYREDGRTAYGSGSPQGMILAKWDIERAGEQWTVTGVHEHP